MTIKVAGVFGDHMVLQQGVPIPVWGWAEPGTKITLSFGSQRKMAAPDATGKWVVRLDPLPASRTPAAMTIQAKAGKRQGDAVKFSDVLVGEVWLASGQSNMEWPLTLTNDAAAETAAAQHPELRLFTVPRVVAEQPLADVGPAAWAACTPATVANFSAVAYFFGRELQRRLGVPVGLLNSSWGGTVAEAWTSREGLLVHPESRQLIDEFDRLLPDAENLRVKWRQALKDLEDRTRDTGDTGHGRGWADLPPPAGDWQDLRLPGPWQSAGLNFSGIFWFRKDLELPAAWAGRDLKLAIGACDKSDLTYFNNVKVGSVTMQDRGDSWCFPRVYTVPGRLVRAGHNVIAVRVHSNIYHGGMTGPAAAMTLSLADDAQAAPVPLAGVWRYAIEANYGLVQPPSPAPPGPDNPNFPTALHNSMIAPVAPYAIRGVIWYQGESNTDRPRQYRTLFPALIRDWRRVWGQGDFPFLFVQLANYLGQPEQPGDSQWAELREAQALALGLPHTGMAVAIDIGDAADVHPRNKQDVGHRLALLALANAYRVPDLPCNGPLFLKSRRHKGTMRLRFRFADGGLVCHGPQLTGFAVAGPDRKFVWATAVIDGDTVIVSSPQVPNPVAVRYAWADNPACNLYNGAGLPASPFRTDYW